MTTSPLVLLDVTDRVARLTLNRPARHNSLVPELLDDFHAALDRVDRENLVAVVLDANGRSFSTGGDLRGFLDAPRHARRAYADALVGALNRAILRLIALPCPLIVRLHGPVTGGSCGFVFAADLVAIAPPAFLASYYADIGFAPDGGWTALLPERIGTARAASILMLNRRITAEEAVALGLATSLVPVERLDDCIADWIAILRAKARGSLAAIRTLLMPPDRVATVRAGLERERARFLELIDRPEIEAGIAGFFARPA